MDEGYFNDEDFDKIDYREKFLARGEYENCTFSNCDFSNSDLSSIKFSDCKFMSCNLSLVKLNLTAFRDVAFSDCKLLGLHFDHGNEFGFSAAFENCILNHASFFKRKMKNTKFKNTTLQEVDFSECDLTNSIFDHCDLLRATFDHTVLEKVDFRTASNYSIDPERNKIKKAKFSLEGVPGLLHKYDIGISNS